jgi:DNA-binding response OmpR family regulator
VSSDSAADLLALTMTQGADAVLLEADCGDGDGFALCAKLRGRGYRGPIIFITARDRIAEKVNAFAAGADDYLVKPYDGRELLARLGAVCRRFRSAEHLALGRDLRIGDATLSPGTGTFRIDGRAAVYLSPTEVRLLECLMRDSPVTISRDALLERAWPHAFVGDSSRVDVVIARIRKKIEKDPSGPAYLHTVRGFGYAFHPPVKSYVSPADADDQAAESLIGA